MLGQKDLYVEINGKKFPLLITLGFWKRCGFKREEAQIITEDPEIYLNSLKLALFYGSKKEYGWQNLSDMEKMITDEVLEELTEDYSQQISYAIIHYLPEKLRKLIIEKMNIAEKQAEAAIDAALIDQDMDLKKK